MTKLEDKLQEYADAYTKKNVLEIEKKVIRNNIQPFYDEQEQKIFKVDNLLIREAKREGREFLPGIYDYLEDFGLLPLAVSLDKGLASQFNFEHAKINQVKKLKLYAGGKKFIDKESIFNKYDAAYDGFVLDELTEKFKENFMEVKLSEADLESKKTELMNLMLEESIGQIKSEMGTLRIEEDYDLDINFIFDALSGRKELYIKEAGTNNFEIILLPEFKKAILPKTFSIFENNTLMDYTKQKPLETSGFIKKREFTKLAKEGYKGFYLEVPVDPMEFFKLCKVSFEKVGTLMDEGLLDPIEIQSFIVKNPEKDVSYFEVITEASAESRRQMLDKKMLKRSQQFDSSNIPASPFDNIQLDSFSF